MKNRNKNVQNQRNEQNQNQSQNRQNRTSGHSLSRRYMNPEFERNDSRNENDSRYESQAGQQRRSWGDERYGEYGGEKLGNNNTYGREYEISTIGRDEGQFFPASSRDMNQRSRNVDEQNDYRSGFSANRDWSPSDFSQNRQNRTSFGNESVNRSWGPMSEALSSNYQEYPYGSMNQSSKERYFDRDDNSVTRSGDFQEPRAGQYFGKGPKGYARSDERIREEVSECLADHPEVDASEIEVKVERGQVTLTGTVEDRRTKRLTEDAVEKVRGVKDVTNQLRVASNQERASIGQDTRLLSVPQAPIHRTTNHAKHKGEAVNA